MRALRIVVLVLAMLVLATQAVRHFYVRFIEPRTSVLDKYDQTETQKAIKSAGSLDELLTKYDPARIQADDLDKQLKKMEEGKTKDEIEVTREKFKLLRPGGLRRYEMLIKLARLLSPQPEATYPPWQGMQYMHNMFSGLAKLTPLYNGRYPWLQWTTVREVVEARQLAQS